MLNRRQAVIHYANCLALVPVLLLLVGSTSSFSCGRLLLCPWCLQDILAVLDRVHAAHINFNAITANNIVKALHTIADKEGFALQQEAVDGIAQAAAGDLRNAVQSLQLMHMQEQGPTAVAAAGRRGSKALGKGKVGSLGQ